MGVKGDEFFPDGPVSSIITQPSKVLLGKFQTVPFLEELDFGIKLRKNRSCVSVVLSKEKTQQLFHELEECGSASWFSFRSPSRMVHAQEEMGLIVR